MQTQPKPAVRTTQLKPASARREQRCNVIQWRAEALRRRQPHLDTRTLPSVKMDSDPSIARMLFGVAIALVAWAAFGKVVGSMIGSVL